MRAWRIIQRRKNALGMGGGGGVRVDDRGCNDRASLFRTFGVPKECLVFADCGNLIALRSDIKRCIKMCASHTGKRPLLL